MATGGIMSTPLPRFFIHGDTLNQALRLLYSMGQGAHVWILMQYYFGFLKD